MQNNRCGWSARARPSRRRAALLPHRRAKPRAARGLGQVRAARESGGKLCASTPALCAHVAPVTPLSPLAPPDLWSKADIAVSLYTMAAGRFSLPPSHISPNSRRPLSVSGATPARRPLVAGRAGAAALPSSRPLRPTVAGPP